MPSLFPLAYFNPRSDPLVSQSLAARQTAPRAPSFASVGGQGGDSSGIERALQQARAGYAPFSLHNVGQALFKNAPAVFSPTAAIGRGIGSLFGSERFGFANRFAGGIPFGSLSTAERAFLEDSIRKGVAPTNAYEAISRRRSTEKLFARTGSPAERLGSTPGRDGGGGGRLGDAAPAGGSRGFGGRMGQGGIAGR